MPDNKDELLNYKENGKSKIQQRYDSEREKIFAEWENLKASEANIPGFGAGFSDEQRLTVRADNFLKSEDYANLTLSSENMLESGNKKVTEQILKRFEKIRSKLTDIFVGQEKYLDNLEVSFRRPYVMQRVEDRAKNVIFVIGPKSSGRHKSIECIASLMGAAGILDNGEINRIDLGLYPTISEQAVFLSDLYSALYNKSQVVVFDNFEKCHASFINILEELCVSGKTILQTRYALQNKNLVETTGALLSDTISKITTNRKYLVFVTEKSESAIQEFWGSRFFSIIGDILYLDKYSEEEIYIIINIILQKLTEKCRKSLGFNLFIGQSVNLLCAKKYNISTGFAAVEKYIFNNIYRPLVEYHLRNATYENMFVLLYINNNLLTADFDDNTVQLSSLVKQPKNSHLDEVKKELASVIGLEKVKEYVYSLEQNYKVQQMRESRGEKVSSISSHMIFSGNPGTGKTTIARIVAKYLKALGILAGGQLREVSRSDLVGQYVGHTARLTNEVIKSALGGVLFIDEAYSLCRGKNDTFGLEAIDALVKGMEDNRDDLIVILAGYTEEMKSFLQTNPGLKSRFPNIIEFEDYSAEEMYKMSLHIAKGKGYHLEDKCQDDLLRLFEKSQIKGKNESGNGRLVRNIIEDAILKQSKRVLQDSSCETSLLMHEDFGFDNYEHFDLDTSLEKIIGLENVKAFVRNQHNMIVAEEKRRKAGIKVDAVQSLNMIFTGNPGTGKTTIARVMSQMFKDMGFLKSGQLIEVDGNGLIAEYVGQTSKKTEEIFRSALGGVLFIDEAYSLTNLGNSFGKEAIDTLVKLIEDYKGEIVVVLAGYKKEMGDFIKSNSGLQSRFPIQIDFPDYSAWELMQIALKTIDAKGFKITEDAKPVLQEQVNNMHKKAGPLSGNGRMIRNFVEKIMRNQSARIAYNEVANEELALICREDIEESKSQQEKFDLDEELDKVIGLTEIKTFIRSLHARLRLHKERKRLGLPTGSSQSLHMVFKGNPGTGKTMIARIIAKILNQMGLLNSDIFVETDRAGLVAGYVGQTAIKTTEKVMEAMDGILFIDEAYALAGGGSNDFGKEAIDTLVKMIDDHRERLIVILAGYSQDMDGFLAVNPGLKSRFPYVIEFPDYEVRELMQIANNLYAKSGYEISQEAETKLNMVLEQAKKEKSFGNGRYVRNIFERSLNKQALRLSKDTNLTREKLSTIIDADIEKI